MAANTDIIPVISVSDFAELAADRLKYHKRLREQGLEPLERVRPLMLLGAPGGGKTHATLSMIKEEGASYIMTQDGNYSLPDFVGVPSIATHEVTKQGMTVFNPPEMIQAAHESQVLDIWMHDDFTDAPNSIQNAMCGMVYDAVACGFKIDPYTLHILTGNLPEHKAGANAVISKLLNRAMVFIAAQDGEGTVRHFMTQEDMDPDTVAFLHWKGDDAIYGKEGFDPRYAINNTPRQWAAVARLPAPDFTDRVSVHKYTQQASALVRKGEVAELVAFRKLINDPAFVPIEKIVADPEGAPVPDKIDVCYALGSRLLQSIKETKHFEHSMRYISRLRPEPQTWFVNACVKLLPQVQGTRAYINWARTNKTYFTGR
jgi:hypothetical protein